MSRICLEGFFLTIRWFVCIWTFYELLKDWLWASKLNEALFVHRCYFCLLWISQCVFSLLWSSCCNEVTPLLTHLSTGFITNHPYMQLLANTHNKILFHITCQEMCLWQLRVNLISTSAKLSMRCNADRDMNLLLAQDVHGYWMKLEGRLCLCINL